MRNDELEARVHAAIDRSQTGAQYEDSRIELKTEWPKSPEEAARRIAGHLNAARDEWAIWIIGAKPDGTVVGAEQKELANWWPQVQRQFDQLAPQILQDIVVPQGDRSVVAMLFDATRVPFVIKRDGDRLETPWREGTRVRSARREDLLRILVPESRAPVFEVLEAGAGDGGFVCTLSIVPRTSDPVAFVNHRTRVAYDGGDDFVAPVQIIPDRSSPKKIEHWVHVVPTGVVMDRGGTIVVKSRWFSKAEDEQCVTIYLARANPSESPLVIRLTLVRRGTAWVLK